jgi:hypothetical protein
MKKNQNMLNWLSKIKIWPNIFAEDEIDKSMDEIDQSMKIH